MASKKRFSQERQKRLIEFGTGLFLIYEQVKYSVDSMNRPDAHIQGLHVFSNLDVCKDLPL